MRFSLWTGLAALLGLVAPLRGQASGGGSEVRGRVTQAGDTAITVGGAEVELVGSGLRREADREGRFRLVDVRPGTWELRVRMPGFQPFSTPIVVDSGRVYNRDVSLDRLPQALGQVQINGRLLDVPSRFREPYERAAKMEGKFITREDIEQRNPRDIQSLLYEMPGVLMNDRGITFQRCQATLPSSISVEGHQRQQAAKVQVYIDGVLVTHPGEQGVDNPNDAWHILKTVNPRLIQIMEIYTGVARIPGEFLSDACAVIAIWTKSY